MTITVTVPDDLVARLNKICQERGFGPIEDENGNALPRGEPLVRWLDNLIAAEVRACRIQAIEADIATEEKKETPNMTLLDSLILKLHKTRRAP